MDVAYLCRTCGAKCPSLAGWEDRGQLCVRCANPTRLKPPVQSIFLNGVEVVGAENIAAAIRERDPFRDAIDRAAADWADDNPDL